MNLLKNLFKKNKVNPKTTKEEIIKESKQMLQLQNLRVKAKLLKPIHLNTPEGVINLEIGTDILVDPEKNIGQYSFYDFGMKKEEYKVKYCMQTKYYIHSPEGSTHIFEFLGETKDYFKGKEVYCSEGIFPKSYVENFKKTDTRPLEDWEVVKYKLEGKI